MSNLDYPFISCKCITYGRVNTLEESIYSFINQDYPGKKELIIVNDYPLQQLEFDHPEVKIFNLDYTFPTIGDKENFAASQCQSDIIATWDDDDIALPNHLTNIAKYFKKDTVLLQWNRGVLFNYPDVAAITGLGNSGFIYSKKAWEELGGHPLENAGYDMTFVITLKNKFPNQIAIASPPDDEVSWIYYWGGRSYHMSGLGADNEKDRPNVISRHSEYIESERKLGKIPTGNIKLEPKWEFDYIEKVKNFVKKQNIETLKSYKIQEGYTHRLHPGHHDDSNWEDQSQYEVYQYCAKFMELNNLQTVVDVGCGSGFKLIKDLGKFKTIGTETEPCYSLLKSKYPDREWYLAGEPEKSFYKNPNIENADVVLCCDVIEHIIDPDILLEYLLSLNAKYYIISTPCREVLCKNPRFSAIYGPTWDGPPLNGCHVREWTMKEFTEYLSEKFEIVHSFYGEKQIECQYHLLKKPQPIKKILVTTACFSSGLHSKWINQKSDKYEIVFNRIDDYTESARIKSMSPRLRGKISKMIIWEDHPGYDYYIWADSLFSIINENAIEKLVDECLNVDACFFKHTARNSVKEESDFVLQGMAEGNQYLLNRYNGERIKEQTEHYSKDITWNDNCLFECGIFIYSKSIIENKEYNLMKEWFYQNCLWSVEDQLSLPYLIHKFNINYKILPGNVYENEYFKII